MARLIGDARGKHGIAWTARFAFSAACLFSACCPGFSQDRHLVSTAMGQEAILRRFTEWGKDCVGHPPAKILLDLAPAHGSVCFRRGEMTPRTVVIGPAKYPHCFGTTMDGVHLVYIPHGAFVGTDRVAYTVVYSRGRVPYQVEITIQQTQVDGPKQRRPEKFAPNGSEGKGPPVPECAPLVSRLRDAPSVAPHAA